MGEGVPSQPLRGRPFSQGEKDRMRGATLIHHAGRYVRAYAPYAGPAAKQRVKPNFRSASPRPAVLNAQPVAHASLREDVRGRLRPGFDLLPELAHIDPQILYVA